MAFTGNTCNLNQVQFLDDGNPDGTRFSTTPPSNPRQQPIQRYGGGQVITYQQTLSPTATLAITTAEKSLTVGTTAGNGPLASDFLAAINKPTAQTGLGTMNGRISAANTVALTMMNNSGATVTPTTSQIYNIVVLRGLITNTQTLTPTAVPANMTSEQTFALSKSDPVITLTVDGVGGLATATLVSGGTGLYHVPSAVVVDDAGGIGGVLKLDVNTSGVVTQVTIVKKGRGYITPTVKYVGGGMIAEDMFVMVNKPSCDVGLCISNVRAAGNNSIAIQYANPTAATLTPTSEAYVICGLDDLPSISNIASYGMVGTGISSVASQTSTEQSVTVNGILSTDILIGGQAQKPTLIAGLVPGGSRISADNTISIGFYNATAAAITPAATEIYGVAVYTQKPLAPFKRYSVLLTPASVAANLSVEQTFPVTGLPFINSSPATVGWNKPTHTPGLVITGMRISAADTLAVAFMNLTTNAIVPPAETYKIGCFNAVGTQGGVPGGWVALAASPTLQKTMEQCEEHNDFLITRSFLNGA